MVLIFAVPTLNYLFDQAAAYISKVRSEIGISPEQSIQAHFSAVNQKGKKLYLVFFNIVLAVDLADAGMITEATKTIFNTILEKNAQYSSSPRGNIPRPYTCILTKFRRKFDPKYHRSDNKSSSLHKIQNIRYWINITDLQL